MKNFCIYCLEEEEVIIKENERTEVIKGHEITYIEKETFCSECGKQIDVPEISDMNIDRVQAALRGKLGLIQNYEIKEISSEKAYTECLEAVRKRLDNVHFTNAKIDNVVKYIIYKVDDISILALMKLLYFSQGVYAAFTQRYLFVDECEAWVLGPVYRDTYNRYKDVLTNMIENHVICENDIALDSYEKEVINAVLETFGRCSPSDLVKITHREAPWLNARKGLSAAELSNRIIPKESIKNYFEHVKTKRVLATPFEFIEYVSDMKN